MKENQKLRGPDSVPFLMSQPTQGDIRDSLQQVSRYGTYEVQDTSNSELFFPIIAAGRYDRDALHRLRMQTRIGNDPQAEHDLAPDGPDDKQERR